MKYLVHNIVIKKSAARNRPPFLKKFFTSTINRTKLNENHCNFVFISILLTGPSGFRVMTRNELYIIMQRSTESTFEGKLKFMEEELLSNYAENDRMLADAKQKLSMIRHQFKQKWLAARKMKARFEETNADWLNGTISLPSAGG